jgi:ribosomal protein S18 acetylase RimI-like enzyme
MNFVCRPARAADAAACAPLVFASGEAEFGYMFGVAADECIAFLQHAFESQHGRFSYRRHRVAVDARGDVCSVLAVHESGNVVIDDLVFAWQAVRRFGWRRAINVLVRGARLATELPAPSPGQALIAHCATRAESRSQGALTALMTSVLKPEAKHRFVLDVRLENIRARALYCRLGFETMPRRRARRHPRLPEGLASERMKLRTRLTQ